jgi:hypothetical protein
VAISTLTSNKTINNQQQMSRQRQHLSIVYFVLHIVRHWLHIINIIFDFTKTTLPVLFSPNKKPSAKQLRFSFPSMCSLIPFDDNDGWFLNPFEIQNENHLQFVRSTDYHVLKDPYILDRHSSEQQQQQQQQEDIHSSSNTSKNQNSSKKRKNFDTPTLQFAKQHHDSIQSTFENVLKQLKILISNNLNINNNDDNNNEKCFKNSISPWFKKVSNQNLNSTIIDNDVDVIYLNENSNLNDIDNRLIVNNSSKDLKLSLNQIDNGSDEICQNTFILPPLSSFFNGNIDQLKKITTNVNNLNLLIVDFPWESKSVKRSRKYKTMSPSKIKSLKIDQLLSGNMTFIIFCLLLLLDIKWFCAAEGLIFFLHFFHESNQIAVNDSIVVFWLTNKEANRRFIYNTLKQWHLVYVVNES